MQTFSIIRYCLILSFGLMISQEVLALHRLCQEDTRACVIESATAYLDALVSHDPSKVPLAENAKRWENGVNTGQNAEAIRNGLKNYFGFKTIQNLHNLRWLVDGNQAIVFYLIESNFPYTHIHYGTTHVVERFKVQQGLIEEIEAIFCASANKNKENSLMDNSKLSFMCTRSFFNMF